MLIHVGAGDPGRRRGLTRRRTLPHLLYEGDDDVVEAAPA